MQRRFSPSAATKGPDKMELAENTPLIVGRNEVKVNRKHNCNGNLVSGINKIPRRRQNCYLVRSFFYIMSKGPVYSKKKIFLNTYYEISTF